MIRRVLIFWVGCAALFLLSVMPFRILLEDEARANAMTAYAATAMLLCLIPTTITLAWSAHALKQDPNQQMALVLGGTGIRMFFVLLGALGLHDGVAYYQKYSGFWMWVLVFYLLTLALEMGIMLAGRSSADQASGTKAVSETSASTDQPAELVE